MKKYHINYANNRYYKSQQMCSDSARQAGFDIIISYSYDEIDPIFKNKNYEILKQHRGAGYWCWKSYFINKTMDQINDGDLLVYSDAGSVYKYTIDPLVELIKKDPNGVLSFELTGLIEKEYTKMDTFNLMGLNNPKYTDSSQREGTYIWLIKNKFTVNLVKEYLEYSQNINIITDLPNITGSNYPEFKDHRHDQSIWSLLCKKYNIEKHRLISNHGLHLVNDFPNDTYPDMTLHHRNPM